MSCCADTFFSDSPRFTPQKKNCYIDYLTNETTCEFAEYNHEKIQWDSDEEKFNFSERYDVSIYTEDEIRYRVKEMVNDYLIHDCDCPENFKPFMNFDAMTNQIWDEMGEDEYCSWMGWDEDKMFYDYHYEMFVVQN